VWTSPATRAKHGCIVSGERFCGKIHRFHDQKSCFKSNQGCEKDVQKCRRNKSAKKETCQKMERLCKMQFLYCTECKGSKHGMSKDNCELSHFVLNKKD
jgi:hypothetical protein